MLGVLNKSQMDDVLYHETVGRLGCSANHKVYVVPVSYAYDGKYIYAHSKEGAKIDFMRKNPSVCFEVDSVENMANWRSVILWGTFEEMKTDREWEKGLKALQDRFMPLVSSETRHKPQQMRAPHIVEKEKKAIVYRINIQERSGRFEKTL